MAFVPVPDAASFELIYDVFGQRVENVLHVVSDNTFDATKLADISQLIVEWFEDYGKDLMHNATTLEMVVAKDLSSQTGPAIEYTTGLPIVGTVANVQELPLNVTACVSFGTALRGRSYRGRLYQTALTVASVVENVLSTNYRSALIVAYQALIDTLNVGTYSLAVVSKYSNKAPRTTGVATPIINVSVDPNVDSQRRRLNGRGQ